MTRTIRLNRVGGVLSAFEYPVAPATVATACDDVMIRLADGEVNLGATVGDSTATEFGSAEELTEEVMSLLPRRAVGEPFQSDGDA
ncbi:DUF5789 family protein [Halorubrum halodurans]|uniref:Uncharacterized protein n=1 Tax=Halorubrum halodurans TaxID=1383851 RepID=A0A256INN5_9EURY|nr:hypothetical protein [Halorubrum halodurans]OYR58179.1 hypothetical protein DJ70_04025 [Halorubrum halodurans]